MVCLTTLSVAHTDSTQLSLIIVKCSSVMSVRVFVFCLYLFSRVNCIVIPGEMTHSSANVYLYVVLDFEEMRLWPVLTLFYLVFRH